MSTSATALAVVKELYPYGLPNVSYCYTAQADNAAAILEDQKQFADRIASTKAFIAMESELARVRDVNAELAAALKPFAVAKLSYEFHPARENRACLDAPVLTARAALAKHKAHGGAA